MGNSLFCLGLGNIRWKCIKNGSKGPKTDGNTIKLQHSYIYDMNDNSMAI